MGDTTNFNIRLIIIAARKLGILSAPTPADIIYVDDDAPLGGNGSSWPAAFKYLQDALTAAWYGDEIRVAQGTYKPDRDEAGNVIPGRRSSSFILKSGLAIYGGYAGIGSPDPNDRNTDLYMATLNGDLAGNDGPDFANNDENCYNVVKSIEADANAILDGFTVTSGHADGSWYDHFGGGVLVLSGSPVLTNCIFINNSASYGGAACNRAYSSATWINCAFTDNLAEDGGGMYNDGESGPKVMNCTFSGNLASHEFTIEGEGGGMLNHFSSSPTVVDCTFIDNSANIKGGGLSNVSDYSTMINCTFRQNMAGSFGGGVYIWSTDPILRDCTFIEKADSTHKCN